MDNKQMMLDVYLAGHREFAKHVTVGKTRVRVTRKAGCYEGGWSNSWASPEMDGDVGRERVITRDSSEGGFRLGVWHFPYFVLEIVDEPETKTNNPLDGLDFGCNQEKVRTLIERLDERYQRKATP